MDAIERIIHERPLAQAWHRVTVPLPIVGIGAGGIVRSAHLPAYARLHLPVLGVFDPRADVAAALARDFSLPATYASLDEAVAAGDAAGALFDVAVPAEAIASVLERLPSGAAVLIQKPFGRDLEEARSLLALCREKSLRAAVNFQLRFSPNVLALRDALRRGLLGDVVFAEVRVNVHMPWQSWDFLRGIPRHEILYHSIHYLDLLRALLGEPHGVYAKVSRSPALTDYADTSSTTILDYGEALRAVVSTFHDHDTGLRHANSELRIEGTSGAAVLRLGVNLDYPRGQSDTLELVQKGSDRWHQVPLRGGWFDHAFEGTMSNLQRFARGEDRALESSVSDAARTMALVEACYLSSRSGATPIPEVRD